MEETTKQAWLARLDAPSWAFSAQAVAEVASEADTTRELMEQCGELLVDEACAQLSTEDEAKKAWLAKLDATTWGAVAAAVTEIWAEVTVAAFLDQCEQDVDQARYQQSMEARAAWLARLDAAAWDRASTALVDIAGDAAVISNLSERCACGEPQACKQLATEVAAQRNWLAKLDTPTRIAVTAAVESVAAEVAPVQAPLSAKDIAKHTWR